MRIYIFLSSTKWRIFPLSFLCGNIGFAKGDVMIMPYICIRASALRISPLRLLGAGSLWL